MMMLVYCRDHELPIEVEDLGCGVGRIRCIECGGDGDAQKFYGDLTEAMAGSPKCVDCKGTGHMLVGL
jgi:hypothetical protein